MSNGRKSKTSFRESRATRDARRRTIAVSSMRCFGLPGPEPRGGISQSVSENGTPSSSDSTDGPVVAYGDASYRSGWTLTLNVSCWTPPSFAPTSTPREREKKGGPSPRPFARRVQHQAAHRRRSDGTTRRTDPYARTGPRHDPSAPPAGRTPSALFDRGQRLRQRRVHKRNQEAPEHSGHPLAIGAHGVATPAASPIPPPQPRRTLCQPHQAFSSSRHPL